MPTNICGHSSDVKEWAEKPDVKILADEDKLENFIDTIYETGNPLPMKQLVNSLKQIKVKGI